METFKDFADRHRVKVKRDPCGNDIIPGKLSANDMRGRVEYRRHVYDGFADGRVGLCLMYLTKRRWNRAQRLMLGAGLIRHQACDTEGCFTFDSSNAAQVRLAFKLAGIKHRRTVSMAQRAVLDRLNIARGLPKASENRAELVLEPA